jgi:ADP-heptose:LPS heptosyltransferase
VTIDFSRRQSDLHESQLNLKLLAPFGLTNIPDLSTLSAGAYLRAKQPLPNDVLRLLDPGKYSLIVHPTSNGSAREWPIASFLELIDLLPDERFQIVLSGTAADATRLSDDIRHLPARVVNLQGNLSLDELISLIDACDGLIAASTGPLHIAAAMGRDAFGLYPPIRPMHPGRWAPIGPKARVFCASGPCSVCEGKPKECHCMAEIRVSEVLEQINQAAAEK